MFLITVLKLRFREFVEDPAQFLMLGVVMCTLWLTKGQEKSDGMYISEEYQIVSFVFGQ